jgi:DNA repair exonuclease SbcCD nuclease subunit
MIYPDYKKRMKDIPIEDRTPLLPKSTKHIKAILCADIHLSHVPPVSRSTEPCWYSAMLRPLKQLSKLQKEYQVPILCAGDLFHKWNPPPELINFALEHLPPMYAIPGQHDLPMHSYKDIKKSAYWTLVKAEKILNLPPDAPLGVRDLRLHAFPWGYEPKPLTNPYGITQEWAVVHKYLWIKGKSYQSAPEANRLKKCKGQFKGYDLVVIGDNHIPWVYKRENINNKVEYTTQIIVNCGSLMRRNIDQIDYKPAVWLVHDDNTAEPHYLDVSKDKFLETEDLKKVTVGGKSIGDFLRKILDLKDVTISFEEAVERYLKKESVSDEVKNIVLAAIEGAK